MSTQTASNGLEWTLGDRLRKSLEVAGITQEEMAAELGYDRRTIGNWVNGRHRPKRAAITAWAAACGPPITTAYLENGVMPRGGPSDQGMPSSRWTRAA